MLNELINLFTSAQSVSSESYYNATQSLHEFLMAQEVVRALPQVSENLGDSLVWDSIFGSVAEPSQGVSPIVSVVYSHQYQL